MTETAHYFVAFEHIGGFGNIRPLTTEAVSLDELADRIIIYACEASGMMLHIAYHHVILHEKGQTGIVESVSGRITSRFTYEAIYALPAGHLPACSDTQPHLPHVWDDGWGDTTTYRCPGQAPLKRYYTPPRSRIQLFERSRRYELSIIKDDGSSAATTTLDAAELGNLIASGIVALSGQYSVEE